LRVCRVIIDEQFISRNNYSQGRRQKNFQEGANGKKKRKIVKKVRKIAILSLFQGGQRKQRPKNCKKRNIALLICIFVPCMKIQGGHALPPADAHEYSIKIVIHYSDCECRFKRERTYYLQ